MKNLKYYYDALLLYATRNLSSAFPRGTLRGKVPGSLPFTFSDRPSSRADAPQVAMATAVRQLRSRTLEPKHIVRARSDPSLAATSTPASSPSPSTVKRAQRESRWREIAAHAAAGATIGGITLGPVGIAVGCSKGLAFGIIASEESIAKRIVQWSRKHEPSAVRQLRIGAQDATAKVRVAAHHAMLQLLEGTQHALRRRGGSSASKSIDPGSDDMAPSRPSRGSSWPLATQSVVGVRRKRARGHLD